MSNKNKILLSAICVIIIAVAVFFVYNNLYTQKSDLGTKTIVENTQQETKSPLTDSSGSVKSEQTIEPVISGNISIFKDIQYATITGVDKKYLSLDLYLPNDYLSSKTKLPLVIYIHGGGWRSGDKDTCSEVKDLLSVGFAGACINYRLSDISVFPAAINDVKSAVRWLRANADKYNLDTDKFGAWGSSAGGHLAALLGTSGNVTELEGTVGITGYSSRVQAVVDWFGPTDFSKVIPLKKTFKEYYEAAGQLLGGPGANLENYTDIIPKANPITYVDKNDPSFLIMHGKKDDIVMTDQSQLLYNALIAKGAKAELKLYENEGHSLPSHAQEVVNFFSKELKDGIIAK